MRLAPRGRGSDIGDRQLHHHGLELPVGPPWAVSMESCGAEQSKGTQVRGEVRTTIGVSFFPRLGCGSESHRFGRTVPCEMGQTDHYTKPAVEFRRRLGTPRFLLRGNTCGSHGASLPLRYPFHPRDRLPFPSRTPHGTPARPRMRGMFSRSPANLISPMSTNDKPDIPSVPAIAMAEMPVFTAPAATAETVHDARHIDISSRALARETHAISGKERKRRKKKRSSGFRRQKKEKRYTGKKGIRSRV